MTMSNANQQKLPPFLSHIAGSLIAVILALSTRACTDRADAAHSDGVVTTKIDQLEARMANVETYHSAEEQRWQQIARELQKIEDKLGIR